MTHRPRPAIATRKTMGKHEGANNDDKKSDGGGKHDSGNQR